MNSTAADECTNLDESAGCGAFLTALKVNVIVAYVYSLGHCCLPGPCLIVYVFYKSFWGYRRLRRGRERNRELDDSVFDSFESD